LLKGKIIRGVGGFYYVHDGISHVYECRARGLFRKEKMKPLVGDDVTFEPVTDTEKEWTGNITGILPRHSALRRPAVSNVDQALVVFAVTDPEPNLNLLDRFLVMMEIQRVPVIICFSKDDLVSDEKKQALRDTYAPAGYPVRFISTRLGAGLPELMELLRGKTTVLAGPSGVGKSTLTNFLQPDAGMEVGELSKKLGRGKNTTRHSELFFVEKDTFVCDTPGFSSITVDVADERDVKQYFPEFLPFEGECRFRECVHVGERDCGVKRAVAAGQIPESRYENYRQIYEEVREMRKNRY
jgi:ribosome biogenesis GTPase